MHNILHEEDAIKAQSPSSHFIKRTTARSKLIHGISSSRIRTQLKCCYFSGVPPLLDANSATGPYLREFLATLCLVQQADFQFSSAS